MNLDKVLCALARSRPVFHSEADFQHALAWEIHTSTPSASLRLEVPMQVDAKRMRLDLLVVCDAERYAIELKYRPTKMTAKVAGEQFSLKNQAARDIGRYEFWKDVTRLEQYVASTMGSLGYAVFLSNDRLYWEEPRPRKPSNMSAEFSIHHTRRVCCGAPMEWAEHAGFGSIEGRENPITCNLNHVCLWKEYSTVGDQEFKYLLLAIERNEQATARKPQV